MSNQSSSKNSKASKKEAETTGNLIAKYSYLLIAAMPYYKSISAVVAVLVINLRKLDTCSGAER